MKTLEPFLCAAAFLGGVALLVVMASTIFGGCNSGSEIPFDPTCVELVTDECVPEVVAEFCDECTSETDILLRIRAAVRVAYLRGFDDGFERGVESVVCETPDPVCEDDIDEDCEDDTHKAVHKHCRGKGHHKAVD